MHIAIAEVLLERNDLEAAKRRVHQAADLGDENGMPQSRYRLAALQARLLQANGDLDGALLLLASDASRYITGQTLLVDGGVSIGALRALPKEI